MSLDEKPFRTEAEPADIEIRMGLPRVRPHVVPAAGKTGPLTKDDFVTRDLHWDGRSFSIELFNESDIEAFGVEMPE